ncbi:MAG: asparagine synthase (glutamine-hydrolyzing) [Cyanobacteria bacterium HKST-UBA04]|nr:asparagine synthase (glutamine-hydrolyzing) [Cyanobacteria bacterium HKST-UBA04]
MCGLVGGLIQTPSSTPFDEGRLWAMLAPIKHRGPNSQAVWAPIEGPATGLGLGHARLSIIDLSHSADQPMHDPDTGHVVVFNGEIYNYLELRNELKAKGVCFQTDSDTEVLLKAYDTWGQDCLNRFNGMWAFALWDAKKRALFCARDRMGIKPFVYAWLKGVDGQKTFVFASESKALLAAYPELKTPNAAYTCHFLETGEFGATQATFYQDMTMLLPGHMLWVEAQPDTSTAAPPEQQRYWQWQPADTLTDMTDDAVTETLEALLLDAIKLRFRSDVPVGVCLSGGLDSSAITALSVEAFGPSFPVFSCVYPDAPSVDESAYIQATVARYGLQSITTTVQPVDLLELMRQTLVEQDGPTGTSSILSQRAVMACAREHVTVVLGGQGGDEVLGGYHGYFDFSLQALMRTLLEHPNPANLAAYWQDSQAIAQRTGAKPHKFKHLKNRLLGACRPAHFESRPFGASVLDSLRPYPNDDLNTRLLEDLTFRVLPRLLHYEDRNSMAVSLESRLPFLDYRLVEFMFRLNYRHKVRGATTKWHLAQLLANRLPTSVLHRKDKMGFNAPSQDWFGQAQNRKALQHYMDNRPDILSPLSEEKWRFLNRAWQKCMAGETLSTRAELNLWRYFITCLWLD